MTTDRSSRHPTFSRVRSLTDGELTDLLRSRGLKIEQQHFEGLAVGFSSAEEMTQTLIERFRLEPGDWDVEWIWMSLAVLWERWLPARPSYEMLNDRMQEGYEKREGRDECGAARDWLDAWSSFIGTIDAKGLKSIDEFDSRFRGTQSIYNWVQDVEHALWNAGLKEEKYFEAGIRFCEEFLVRFSEEEPLITQNMRRAMGSFHASMGHLDTVDCLYRSWLDEDPRWGWGWIGWSDCYHLGPGSRDPARAVGLLREGLAVPGIRDSNVILDRLEMLYTDLNRLEDAEEIRRTFRSMDSPKRSTEPEHEGIVRADGTGGNHVKTGRNELCPCGRNRKFKKCCGR